MKEELVYDHDYPCKSNDSNDGGGRRELDDNSLSASEKTVMVENEKGDVDVDFRFTTPKVQDSGKSCKGHCDRSNHKDDGVWINEPLESVEEKTSETSSVVGSLNIEDLESVLRQRALENLRKFRGGNQTNAKASNDKNKIGSDVKQLSIKKDGLIQNGASSGAKCTEKNLILQGSGVPAVKGDPVSSSTNTRLLNENKGDSKSESAKHDFPSAPEQVTCAGNPNETIKRSIGYVNNNPNLNAPASIHRSSNSSPTLNPKPVAGLQEQLIVSESTIDNVLDANELDSATPKLSSCLRPLLRHNSSNKVKDEVKECSNFELKQTSTSQEPSTKLSVTEGGMDQQAVHTAQNVTQNIDNNGRGLDNLCDSAVHRSSCNVSTSGENEPNQGSQLEQKTMTVMRGGEMVQVSYKVYIPKKAPALSRRQLKR
ncbi:G patch domain-containing protein 8 [Quillaja saponaria]|uniref:G patch domain-containing protein 8 n=1 Tax=Quillaja saponaria TaxID=32244 RepID=A0AAD7QHW6_QUISA|nr:G patch domain-containing protein 8 [Quillaja saponaria]